MSHPGLSLFRVAETEIETSLTSVFLIGIVGGGVQLGPLGTAATNRPIVPAPGDYGDGEIGGMIEGETEVLRSSVVVEALCYNTEGRGIASL
jgi:hypothetical protein